MAAAERFPILFTGANPLMAIIGILPSRCRVDFDDEGRWLVNGSSRNIVEIPIDPPARAFVMGWPVRLRRLAVSVVDRGGFLAALNG